MSLLDNLLYQKNKILARGDTVKEMELNQREIEFRDKREMDRQVQEEHKRRVSMQREQARKEYEIKYAQEEERIKYEQKLSRAKEQSKRGSILDRLSNTVERRSKGQGPMRLKSRKKRPLVGINYEVGKKWF